MKRHYLFWTMAAALASGFSCREKSTVPSQAAITALSLKRGQVITCGSGNQKLGSVQFDITGDEQAQQDFNLGLKLLHSFEYDEAEKVFARIIDRHPTCAMAYWGVAMANFHPLWSPPAEPELKKGVNAIRLALSVAEKTNREAAYIDAIAAFYTDWEKVDHYTRCVRFENAMEALHANYPADKEATVFYALALDAAAKPTDKQFSKQKKAGQLLAALYPNEPNHPGIIHYTIHTYDYPELATLALPAARQYAAVAPSSAHALHMPSHIFTRLGLWQECIDSNLASVASAQCYAAEAGMPGHWDEELHGMDYLVYAHLQRGENDRARAQWAYLRTITEVEPQNFKVAYAFASIPARYVLENKLWKEAASLQVHKKDFPWKDFQWQKGIVHFTRALGLAHTGDVAAAKAELAALQQIHSNLLAQKDAYKASQVEIQAKASEAWIRLKEGNNNEALALMTAAANLEDGTDKHPVTPSEVLPARELLGDMLVELNKPQQALEAYEANLQKRPNRFNGLYGAALAAEKAGDAAKAVAYYKQLLQVTSAAKPSRPELLAAQQYLNSHKRDSI
jgi:tetratricopeptide (TPR) repeat protein